MYNKNHCTASIRRYVELTKGEHVTIIVTGRHAFEWNITIKKANKTSTRIFPGRVEALKEFNHLQTTYNRYGTVGLYL